MIDKLIEADTRRQLLIKIKEKTVEANLTDKKRCGNCDNWMKSTICIREKNKVKTSCDTFACSKFTLTSFSKNLKRRRIRKVKKLKEEL